MSTQTLDPHAREFNPNAVREWAKDHADNFVEDDDEGYFRAEFWYKSEGPDGDLEERGGHIEVHDDGYVELNASGPLCSQWYRGFPEEFKVNKDGDVEILPKGNGEEKSDVPVRQLVFHLGK